MNQVKDNVVISISILHTAICTISTNCCTYKLTPHASVLVQTSTWILAAVNSSSTVFLSWLSRPAWWIPGWEGWGVRRGRERARERESEKICRENDSETKKEARRGSNNWWIWRAKDITWKQSVHRNFCHDRKLYSEDDANLFYATKHSPIPNTIVSLNAPSFNVLAIAIISSSLIFKNFLGLSSEAQ